MAFHPAFVPRPRCPVCAAPGSLGGIGACTWSHFRHWLREVRLRVVVYELGAGRDVVEQVLPQTLPPEAPAQTNWCAYCWASGVILGPDGPEACEWCSGWGSR